MYNTLKVCDMCFQVAVKEYENSQLVKKSTKKNIAQIMILKETLWKELIFVTEDVAKWTLKLTLMCSPLTDWPVIALNLINKSSVINPLNVSV